MSDGVSIGEIRVGLDLANETEHQVIDHCNGTVYSIEMLTIAARQLQEALDASTLHSALGAFAVGDLPGVVGAMHEFAGNADERYKGILTDSDGSVRHPEDQDLLARSRSTVANSELALQKAGVVAEKVETAKAAIAAARAAVAEVIVPLIGMRIDVFATSANATATRALGEERLNGL